MPRKKHSFTGDPSADRATLLLHSLPLFGIETHRSYRSHERRDRTIRVCPDEIMNCADDGAAATRVPSAPCFRA